MLYFTRTDYGLIVFPVENNTTDYLDIIREESNNEFDDKKEQILSCYSKSSKCCINPCENLIESAISCSIDGKQLIIIPVCIVHNKLEKYVRVKPYKMYGFYTLAKHLDEKETFA